MYGFTERSHVYVGNFPLWTAGGYRWALIAWSAGATVIIHQAADLHQPLFRHSRRTSSRRRRACMHSCMPPKASSGRTT